MKPAFHIAASTLVSGILYILFRSWGMAIASFLSGILIDVDHLIDYIIIRGMSCDRHEFSQFIKEKKYWNDNSRFPMVRLLFHGWEWIILLAVIAVFTDWSPVITGLLAGFCTHLLLDLFHNKPDLWVEKIFVYSLLWRWKKIHNTYSPLSFRLL